MRLLILFLAALAAWGQTITDIPANAPIKNLPGLINANVTAARKFSPQAAVDPATCTVGERYFNTATTKERVCYAADTWGDVVTADSGGGTAFRGTTETDSAPLGPELTDGTGWTSTNWTGDYASGFTHTAGNVSPLSRAIAGIANDKYYQLSFTISGRTAGSVSVSLGSTLVDVFSGDAVYTRGPRASGAGALVFTPTNDFDGKISAISVKLITPIANSGGLIYTADSTGAVSVPISAQTATLSNIAIGGGGYNTTGYHNSFFGVSAGSANTTGYFNSFFGRAAGSANTTGNSNSFFGRAAGSANTTGHYNSFFGDAAGSANTTGNSNSFFGRAAGYSPNGNAANSTTTAQYQTFIGYQSGQGSATQRNYLTVVGANAVGDCANCVVLGRAADVVQIPVGTFANLPACAAGTAGMIKPISNSDTQVWGATIVGGGALHAVAYCDGTNWTVMAK